jgi:hypothetical protein
MAIVRAGKYRGISNPLHLLTVFKSLNDQQLIKKSLTSTGEAGLNSNNDVTICRTIY